MSESHYNCFDRAFQCKEVTTQCALAAKSSYPLVDFSQKPTSKWSCFFLKEMEEIQVRIQRLQSSRTVIMPKEAVLGHLG